MDTPAVRLLVYLSEDDRLHRRALCDVIVEQAREHGMAGASIWRGIKGFGPSGFIRTARFPDALLGLPIVVELIDLPERVEGFLPVLRSFAPDALITREPVMIGRRGSPAAAPS